MPSDCGKNIVILKSVIFSGMRSLCSAALFQLCFEPAPVTCAAFAVTVHMGGVCPHAQWTEGGRKGQTWRLCPLQEVTLPVMVASHLASVGAPCAGLLAALRICEDTGPVGRASSAGRDCPLQHGRSWPHDDSPECRCRPRGKPAAGLPS